MARKPLEGTVAENVLKWGTGAINVDGCRVQTGESTERQSGVNGGIYGADGRANVRGSTAGRWPANIIHDGSEEVLAVFPETGGGGVQKTMERVPSLVMTQSKTREYHTQYADTLSGGGSASRFFYAAKASRTEREHGLDALPRGIVDPTRELDSAGRDNPRAGAGRSGEGRANIHPTVKPVDLMRYLTRLVTPPGGLVVDPYAGSGTTGVAAIHEGFRFMGAEQDTAHALIAVTRIEQAVTDEQEARTLATMQIPLF
jgi:site-specific DNA-methyltransferase (adenine-specific)